MEESNVLQWIIFGEGVVSLIMSLLVIFAYYKFKRIKSFAFKLIMLLCVSDCLNSIGYIFVISSIESNNAYCQVQGFFIQYSNVSSFLVTSIIAFNVLITCVYHQKNPERYMNYYFVIGFIVPAVIAIIPSISQKYRHEAPFYCWLDQRDYIYYWVFAIVLFFGILWSSVLFFIFCLVRVYRYLNFAELDRSTAQFYKKLLNFPIIMMICWLPATINRIIMWFNDDYSDHQWIYFMHISFDMLSSILNVCIYGFNEQVRKEFRRYFFSRQGVDDFRDLDDIDNRKKLLDNPALQRINFESQNYSNIGGQANNSDIAFFMNEDDKKLGYYQINRHNKQGLKEINYSQNTDDS